jgi:hypothetical protein
MGKGNPRGDLPSYVTIGDLGGGSRALGGGFLGVDHDPFLVSRADQMPQNLEPRVSEDRMRSRLELLERLERGAAKEDQRTADHQSLYRRAARLSLSPRLAAFDLEEEPRSIREAYGDSQFGRGCLLARRLVEEGVPFVEVRQNGWDTHQDNFERSRELAGQVDPAFAQLVRDLRVRGLLDSTLIVWMGEFGRTPRINPRAGRDHFPRAFSAALAGAGIRGGAAIGRTTRDGMAIEERPVTVADFFRTVCRSLHIDADKENAATLGRPIKVVDGGRAVEELFT